MRNLHLTGRWSIVSIANTFIGFCGISRCPCEYLAIFVKFSAQISHLVMHFMMSWCNWRPPIKSSYYFEGMNGSSMTLWIVELMKNCWCDGTWCYNIMFESMYVLLFLWKTISRNHHWVEAVSVFMWLNF